MHGCAAVLRRVFVAPHYDDVALSCGGAVATCAPVDDVWIVTVFGGLPSGALSRFAREMHASWSLGEAEVAAARRREDMCAQRALGPLQAVWLDFIDAIYRDHGYDSDATLFGELLPGDQPVLAQVAEQLREFGADEYYVPLGIGNHVDHQLVNRAGHRLAELGCRVWAYADLPYALDEVNYGSKRAVAPSGEARLIELSDGAFERKWAAISCYASQLPVIFRDMADPRAAFERYHRAVGSGRLAEQVWPVQAEGAQP